MTNKVYIVYGSNWCEKPTALCAFEDEETADEYAFLAGIACGCYPYKVSGSDVSLHGFLNFHVEPLELYEHGYDPMDIQREVTIEFTGENLSPQRKRISVGGSRMNEDVKRFAHNFLNEQLIKYNVDYTSYRVVTVHEKG